MTADIVAAALDPSGPRHGGKVLVRHFPRDNRPAQIQFLDAFARVGTTEHLPFLLECLHDDEATQYDRDNAALDRETETMR